MLQYFSTRIKIKQFKPFLKHEKCLVTEYFSTESPPKALSSIFESKFNTAEQKYILEKLNEANSEQLQRYNLPKTRIKKLHDWKKKYGKFNKLDDILDVEGLGVKSLGKLCENILQGENENAGESKDKPVKGRGQLLTPVLGLQRAQELKSALGIHLYATGMSWARIEKSENVLTDWNFYEFNLGTKKLTPFDALQLIINISQEIPPSEVYIFEAPVAVTPVAQQSQISINAYIQRTQLLSMLITILSTGFHHNPIYYTQAQKNKTDSSNSFTNIDCLFQPKVFFLRHRLPARLFKTLIGTERISAATTVSNILCNRISDKIVYTPVTISDSLKSMYNNKELPVEKEVLGQSLLLTMTFMDVCVYQNLSSLKIVSSNNR